MTERAFDAGESLHDLVLEPIDVRCPRCDQHARLAPIGDDDATLHSPRRLTCTQCTFSRDHDGQILGFAADGHDPCFGYPLWFRTTTARGTLWAYHRNHLDALRAYLAANNRERAANPTWHNRSYFSRLPRWVKSANNREMVVKALDRLLAEG